MTNSLVGDHHVAVVDVDEDVLEGSDMSGTHLNQQFQTSQWATLTVSCDF